MTGGSMSDNQKAPTSDEIEKLRIKYNFLKFLLGTFVVGILSIVINWQIQEKKLQFEIQTKENDYIAQFLEHGLVNKLERRRDFAAYFVRLSPSDNARARWQNYLEFIEDLISKAKVVERKITEKDRELAAAAEKIAEFQRKAEEARAELTKLGSLVGKDEKKSEEIEEYKVEAKKSSSEAERGRKELEELKSQLIVQRKELASLRTEPIDLEVHFPITADNIATQSETREDFWDWTIYLNGPEDVLEQVKFVEYTLHPTFPDPVRIVKERSTGPYAFPLSTSGWGTFTVKIKVYYKDGTQQKLAHSLSFDKSKRPNHALQRMR